MKRYQGKVLIGIITTILMSGCMSYEYAEGYIGSQQHLEKQLRENFIQVCTGTNHRNMTCRWIPR